MLAVRVIESAFISRKPGFPIGSLAFEFQQATVSTRQAVEGEEIA
jgi:hypothetical protein